jgi:nucleoside-diphosphate-sugar epimerase
MNTVAITGASGFIGKYLVDAISRSGARIKVLSRNAQRVPPLPGMQVIEGDIRDPAAVRQLLEPGCTVINLVYLQQAAENVNVAADLVKACREVGVKRLIHCSTAVVAGRAAQQQITENAACLPVTAYGKTKLEIEQVVLEGARNAFDCAILRPTAVFGPGGQNLRKLANDLRAGKRIRNYLKSCLFDARRMNLVHVENVVAAILFLVAREADFRGEVFTISDSDEPTNNFAEVERILMRQLDIPDYALPRIPVPAAVLGLLLRCLGQENINPRADYSSAKLMRLGFQRVVGLEAGIAQYARAYRSAASGEP